MEKVPSQLRRPSGMDSRRACRGVKKPAPGLGAIPAGPRPCPCGKDGGPVWTEEWAGVFEVLKGRPLMVHASSERRKSRRRVAATDAGCRPPARSGGSDAAHFRLLGTLRCRCRPHRLPRGHHAGLGSAWAAPLCQVMRCRVAHRAGRQAAVAAIPRPVSPGAISPLTHASVRSPEERAAVPGTRLTPWSPVRR